MLHLGSLVCALASYLDARAHHGQWLVRIEDIDPPREEPGAASAILATLENHGLTWDQPPRYQSAQTDNYRARLAALKERGLSYRCDCTRARIKAMGGSYDGHCRHHPPSPTSTAATRLDINACLHELDDSSRSHFIDSLEDVVIHRKDGLFAYQLAVVSDDIDQGISHVVRGRDLALMTETQRLLFMIFGQQPPDYFHIPLIVDPQGHKLSKQNHARPIENRDATRNLLTSCKLLGLIGSREAQSNLAISGANDILAWAIGKWRRDCLPTENMLAPNDYQG